MESSTKDRILDVAQSLVQTIGANAMSYQHISDEVGIRKASIHHHFATKELLLDAVISRYSERFFGVVDGILESRKSGLGKLREYIGLFEATLCDGSLEKACPMGMLGAEVASLGPDAASSVRRFYSANETRLVTMLEAGRADGSLSFDGNAVAMAGTLFSLLEGAMLVARGRGSADFFRTSVDPLIRLLKA